MHSLLHIKSLLLLLTNSVNDTSMCAFVMQVFRRDWVRLRSKFDLEVRVARLNNQTARARRTDRTLVVYASFSDA